MVKAIGLKDLRNLNEKAIKLMLPVERFAWMLELKYLPAGAESEAIEAAVSAAQAQLARYASDPHLVPLLTQGRALKAGALVFTGAHAVHFRPFPLAG